MQILTPFMPDLCAIINAAVHKSFIIVIIFMLIYLICYSILKIIELFQIILKVYINIHIA